MLDTILFTRRDCDHLWNVRLLPLGKEWWSFRRSWQVTSARPCKWKKLSPLMFYNYQQSQWLGDFRIGQRVRQLIQRFVFDKLCKVESNCLSYLKTVGGNFWFQNILLHAIQRGAPETPNMTVILFGLDDISFYHQYILAISVYAPKHE